MVAANGEVPVAMLRAAATPIVSHDVNATNKDIKMFKIGQANHSEVCTPLVTYACTHQ